MLRIGSVCESLETRRLYAADLGLVHQELHRPPVLLREMNGGGQAEILYASISNAHGTRGVATITILSDDGTGTYANESLIPIDDVGALGIDIAAGDLDGDGLNDVAAVTWTVDRTGPVVTLVSQLDILYGDGKGGFDSRRTFVLPHVLETSGSISGFDKLHRLTRGKRIAVGDVNGDGLADVVTMFDDLAVAISERGVGPRQTTSMDGSFSRVPGKLEFPNLIGIGDLDGDGRADIVALVDGALEYAPVEFTVDGTPPSLGTISKVDSFTWKQGVNVQPCQSLVI